MSEEHMQFCNIAEALLLKAMKAWIPTKAKGKEELLYNVPSINQFFDHMNFSIHSSRYAITSEENILNVHVDSANPKEIDGMQDSFMNQPIGCFSTYVREERHVFIGYGRAS
eukprot:12305866-Ditylum_brightwellii.AAC.1